MGQRTTDSFSAWEGLPSLSGCDVSRSSCRPHEMGCRGRRKGCDLFLKLLRTFTPPLAVAPHVAALCCHATRVVRCTGYGHAPQNGCDTHPSTALSSQSPPPSNCRPPSQASQVRTIQRECWPRNLTLRTHPPLFLNGPSGHPSCSCSFCSMMRSWIFLERRLRHAPRIGRSRSSKLRRTRSSIR